MVREKTVTFDPNLFVAKWYCSRVNPEEIPLFAADALEAGFDGPALRRLAGLASPNSSEVGDLFDRALAEIGTVEIRTKEQAILKLAKLTARSIVDEEIDAFAGAASLARFAQELHYPSFLAEFFALDDETAWGDYARSRTAVRDDILAEAKKLLLYTPQ